ncbi:MAG TPA: MFS transporter [Candidatus Limnocylindrales bacterium]|nr:MFS transporter [Candidatus Limnocylindrales bacterium]
MSTPATLEASSGQATERPKPLLIRNRDFRLLWTGESISLLGSEISTIALPSLAVLIFGVGPLGVGTLVALQWIPYVLLAPVMGVFTDWLRRKPLMQIANVARFIILGSLPLAALFGQLTLTQLYLAAVLKGIFDVVFQLAYQAYMSHVVDRPDMIEGNANTQVSRSVALVLGRSAGGGLISAIGAARAIAADALSYLVAAVCLFFIRKPEPEPQPAPRGVGAVLADLKSGVRLTFGNRVLRNLTLMATFGNMAVSLTLAMIIVFAYKNLHLSAGQLGLALGIGSVPILLGAALSRRVNQRLGMGRTLVFTHALLGVAFLLLPTAALGGKGWAIIVIVLSQGIASLTVPIANVGIMTIIQKATPMQAMGRVGGVALPFVWGANALGPMLGSAIAVTFTTVVAFLLASAFAFLAVAWILVGSIQLIIDDVPEDLKVVI